MRSLIRTITALLLGAAFCLAQAAAAQDVEFSIAPQALSSALLEFSKQAKVQVLTPGDKMKDVDTRGVRGKLGLEAALQQLLKDTGFSFELVGTDTVVLKAPAMPAIAMVAIDGGAAAQAPSSTNDKDRKEPKDGQTVVVQGERERPKPFTDANVDIPRTINDAQPYYVLDAQTIERSGAANIEDLLKQRLTMNSSALTNGQNTRGGQNLYGNISSINLRGLGSGKTLVLVNGRRQAGGVSFDSMDSQPDINGIPLNAIDRIEVLPSSASGIYGGGAIGGVVNIVLKKEHTGGEFRATYDNTWNTDSPRRTLAGSYGMSLEGGKTRISLSASGSDASPLLLRDRQAIFRNNLDTMRRNAPNYFYDSFDSPSGVYWTGALPNISPYPSSPLTFKNGVSLGSDVTFVAAGTSPNTPAATLRASLLANAGQRNTDFPPTTQTPYGLLQPHGVTPETRSVYGSIRRQMRPGLEVFADFSYNENNSDSVNSPVDNAPFVLTPASPVNPFNELVVVTFPSALEVPNSTTSDSRAFTLGAVMDLPASWTAQADYTRSKARYSNRYYQYDRNAVSADAESGVINPFVDTVMFPIDLDKYLQLRSRASSSALDDVAFRIAGPLPALPWAAPLQLTAGVGRRISRTPENTIDFFTFTYLYYDRKQIADSGYGEASIPLVKQDRLPALYALDLQIAGRIERFTVDAGTPYERHTANGVSYPQPTLNGQPYFTQATYRTRNFTLGFKYQPVQEVTLRASRATAFLPPTPFQLMPNPEPNSFLIPVNDPRTGTTVSVQTVFGGNPDLRPQNSTSLNLGLIWEPRWRAAQGLRLNAEYYKTEQFDAISALTTQQMVDQENTFPGRVSRNSSGVITLVDTSYLNLFGRETEGMDFTADYTFTTARGVFNLRATESVILHLKEQFSQTLPEYEAAGYHPSEGGSAKYKFNASLDWTWKQLSAGWTTRYFSSYYQVGAAGGPNSMSSADGGVYNRQFYIEPQGSDTVPSQIYHDLHIRYAFDDAHPAAATRLASVLDGLTLQLGIRNVFDKVPPLDTGFYSSYYTSPYGDIRLRTYWINIRKEF